MNKITKTSDRGIKLIKEFETFKSKPYLCPAGVPTIGYGSTYYPDGRKVKLSDPPITEEEASELLNNTLDNYELAVNRLCKVHLNQNQFDALVSFTYNLGEENFRTSTLLKKVNSNPSDPAIANEFARWVKSKGKTLNGLIRRREAESKLYFDE